MTGSRGRAPRMSRREFVAVVGGTIAAGAIGAIEAPAAPATRFPGADEFSGEVATAWLDLSLTLVRRTGGFSPPVASRAFGYLGTTLYEALVPGIDGARSLQRVLPGIGAMPAAGKNASYDWPTVANAALASIARSLFATAPADLLASIASLEASFASRFRTSLPPGIHARSVDRGRAVAAAMFESSRTDGGHEGYLRNFPPYTPPVGPGLWKPTPPGFLSALQPSWGRNRCFALDGGADCPPGAHPPYSEAPGSAFRTEATEVYDTVSGLTPEQERIARFWSDDPGVTATPPGHSISIATQVLRVEQSSLARAAETYARVGVAVSDAFVACWHQKFAYNLLRPVTYIRETLGDDDWLPLLVTPPFPEYPSGHSVQSGAAFHVLTDLFGEAYAFVDHTHDDRGFTPRSFGSFLQAADEAALSRLYGGIHFRAAIENGLAQGRCIGSKVSALPLPGPRSG